MNSKTSLKRNSKTNKPNRKINLNNKVRPKLVKCQNADIEHSYFYTGLDFKKSDRNKAQMVAFPRYIYSQGEESNFCFQTDWIQITNYGLPTLGIYYKFDKERNFVKIPFDEQQPNCMKLKKMLASIDDKTPRLDNIIFKKKALADAYTYQPIVRKPQPKKDVRSLIDEDGKKEDKIEKPKPEYCKMVFNKKHDTDEITTVFYIRTPHPEKPGEYISKKTSIRSATELEKYLTFLSRCRMIVMVNKLWAAKNADKNGVYNYGVTLKIIQMEIEPKELKKGVIEQFQEWAFQDSDGEDDSVTIKNQTLGKDNDNYEEEPEYEEEEEPEDEEEEEEEPEDEDEDEDEYEYEEVEVEDDEDDENYDVEEVEEVVEEVKPPKASKTRTNVKTRKSKK